MGGWNGVVIFMYALFCVHGCFLVVTSRKSQTVKEGGRSILLSLGAAQCIMGVVGILAFQMVSGGRLILSPEFGLIMVQDTKGWLAVFGMLLVAASCAVGITVSECSNPAPSAAGNQGPYWLGSGFLVVLIAATGSCPLHIGQDPPVVLAYGFYLWPLLLTWLCFALAWLACHVFDIRSRSSWLICSAVLVMGLIGGMLLKCLALFELVLLDASVLSCWLISLIAALILVFGALLWGKRVCTAGSDSSSEAHGVPINGIYPRSILMTSSLVLLYCSFVDPWSLSTLETSANFFLFGFSWIILVVTIELQTLNGWRESAGSEKTTRKQPAGVLERTIQWLKAFREARHGWWLSGHPWFVLVTATIALLLVIGVVIEWPNANKTRIVPFKAYLRPNASETDSVEKQKFLHEMMQSQNQQDGELFSDQLARHLSALYRDLSPESALPMHVSQGNSVRPRLNVSRETGEDSGSVLVQNSEINLFGQKLPLGILLSPLQDFLRRLLNVRVISGTLWNTNAGLVAIAASTFGETWKADLKSKDQIHGVKCGAKIGELAERLALEMILSDPILPRSLKTASFEALESFREGMKKWGIFETERDYDSLGRAIWWFSQAATQDPAFGAAFHRLGFALQVEGRPDEAHAAFNKSMECGLKSATEVASKVAAGWVLYGRAGIYLPPPSFLVDPRKEAARATLPPGELHKLEAARATLPPEPYPEEQRLLDAQDRWLSVLGKTHDSPTASSERAGALYGLCCLIDEGRVAQTEKATENQATAARKANHLAYFLCKQSAGIYEMLSTDSGRATEYRRMQAIVLNRLGRVLDNTLKVSRPGDPGHTVQLSEKQAAEWPYPESWVIGVNPVKLRQSSLSALSYYQRAEELDADNPRILRDAVTGAYVVHGDVHVWDRVLTNPRVRSASAAECAGNARYYLASASLTQDPEQKENILNQAKDALKRTKMEYERALKTDPAQLEALVGYADAFWLWRELSTPEERPHSSTEDAGFVRDFAHGAEDRVRQAITIHYSHLPKIEVARLYATLGRLLLSQGRAREAIRELRGAYAYVHESPPQTESEARDHIESAGKALECGRYAKARRCFRKASVLLLNECVLKLGKLSYGSARSSNDFRPIAKAELQSFQKDLEGMIEPSHAHSPPFGAQLDEIEKAARNLSLKREIDRLRLGLDKLKKIQDRLQQEDLKPPENSRYNDLRWVLAQAYLCTCQNERMNPECHRPGDATGNDLEALETEALDLLASIEHSEAQLDSKPYTERMKHGRPDYPDFKTCRKECGNLAYPVEIDPPKPPCPFVLKLTAHGLRASTKWVRVSVSPTPRSLGLQGLKLHLWGGGLVDARHPVEWLLHPGLLLKTQDQGLCDHCLCFAQIEDRDGKPQSGIRRFPIHEDKQKASAAPSAPVVERIAFTLERTP